MALPYAGLVLQAVRAAHATRYAHLASSTIVIYDHLITLGDELDLIWTGSWSLGKALFLINRYYFLFAVLFNNYGLLWANITDNFCHRFFQWQGWTGWFACALAEVILQMRIYALYFADGKKILILMVICFIITTSTSAAIMGIVLSQLHVASRIPLTNLSFCNSPDIPDYFFTFWIPVLIFESLLCALALFRGFQTFKSTGGLFTSGRHLVKVLIRDSIMYFLIMFATYLTSLLVWVVGPIDLLEIPIGFTVALSCVLGNRVILNVLNVKRADQNLERNGPRGRTDAHPPDAAEGSFSPSGVPSAGHLSNVEMFQLRSLRSHHSSHGRSVVV